MEEDKVTLQKSTWDGSHLYYSHVWKILFATLGYVLNPFHELHSIKPVK